MGAPVRQKAEEATDLRLMVVARSWLAEVVGRLDCPGAGSSCAVEVVGAFHLVVVSGAFLEDPSCALDSLGSHDQASGSTVAPMPRHSPSSQPVLPTCSVASAALHSLDCMALPGDDLLDFGLRADRMDCLAT